MIRPTTLRGTKDVLLQYCEGDKYCIIYEMFKDTLGYWLVETTDLENFIKVNELEEKVTHSLCPCGRDHTPISYISYLLVAHAHIPDFIMLQLIEEGFIEKRISDKEQSAQVALGTMPAYNPYMISDPAFKNNSASTIA